MLFGLLCFQINLNFRSYLTVFVLDFVSDITILLVFSVVDSNEHLHLAKMKIKIVE